VLPVGVSLEISRASWTPQDVFKVLAEWGAYQLESLEGTWNLGLGFAAIVDASAASAIAAKLNHLGIKTWQLGVIEQAADTAGFVNSAKGVEGGAVRLSGSYS
jgi:phosphoribosylformylglycinamidine cyclo-ligase